MESAMLLFALSLMGLLTLVSSASLPNSREAIKDTTVIENQLACFKKCIDPHMGVSTSFRRPDYLDKLFQSQTSENRSNTAINTVALVAKTMHKFGSGMCGFVENATEKIDECFVDCNVPASLADVYRFARKVCVEKKDVFAEATPCFIENLMKIDENCDVETEKNWADQCRGLQESHDCSEELIKEMCGAEASEVWNAMFGYVIAKMYAETEFEEVPEEAVTECQPLFEKWLTPSSSSSMDAPFPETPVPNPKEDIDDETALKNRFTCFKSCVEPHVGKQEFVPRPDYLEKLNNHVQQNLSATSVNTVGLIAETMYRMNSSFCSFVENSHKAIDECFVECDAPDSIGTVFEYARIVCLDMKDEFASASPCFAETMPRIDDNCTVESDHSWSNNCRAMQESYDCSEELINKKCGGKAVEVWNALFGFNLAKSFGKMQTKPEGAEIISECQPIIDKWISPSKVSTQNLPFPPLPTVQPSTNYSNCFKECTGEVEHPVAPTPDYINELRERNSNQPNSSFNFAGYVVNAMHDLNTSICPFIKNTNESIDGCLTECEMPVASTKMFQLARAICSEKNGKVIEKSNSCFAKILPSLESNCRLEHFAGNWTEKCSTLLEGYECTEQAVFRGCGVEANGVWKTVAGFVVARLNALAEIAHSDESLFEECRAAINESILVV